MPTPTYALPYKGYSQGTLVGTTWTLHNATPVPHPVLAKKCYFSGPANYLPNAEEPYGSVWRQHMGQVTYFTPGVAIAPAWVCVYLAFFDNFIGQQVKIVLNNSVNLTPHVLTDWTTISYINGQFLPVLQPCELITLNADTSYWVEFHFKTTVNKANQNITGVF